MTKFRKGDRVSVMATVKYDHAGDDSTVLIELDCQKYASIGADAEFLTMVCPHIDAGESVWSHAAEQQGTVLASADGWLWVRVTHQGGGFATWPARDVEVVPPKPLSEEAA